MYYLYKITIKKSPLYYIGATSDLISRKVTHFDVIINILESLMKDDLAPINFSYLGAQHKFAELIYLKVGKSCNPAKEVYSRCSITVLRRHKDVKEINAMESRYISRGGKNCLNVHKKSHYNKENMKEKLYVIRGNNKMAYESCVVKIIYGNRYVIAKMKNHAAGLKRIEDGINSFMRGGTNNPDGLYYHLLNYIKRQPQHQFKVQTLLFSDNPYELLKREQEELDKGRKDKNFLNNQTKAYIPAYNEEKQMYGGWIPQIAVLNFNNWLKNRKTKKTAV